MKSSISFQQGMIVFPAGVVTLSIGSSSALASLGYPCELPQFSFLERFNSQGFCLSAAIAGVLCAFAMLVSNSPTIKAIFRRMHVFLLIGFATSLSTHWLGISSEHGFLAWVLGSIAIGDLFHREPRIKNNFDFKPLPTRNLSIRDHEDGEIREMQQE